MSNLGSSNINDLADQLHYARFMLTDSERQGRKWGNQLPPKPTEATPARPCPREAACLVGWPTCSNPVKKPQPKPGQSQHDVSFTVRER
jgi:hypothetical protein